MITSEKSRYLVVPTSASAEKTKVYLKSREKLLTDLDARVDFANPETVFYYDISRFEGLDVEVIHESGKSFGFSERKPDLPEDPVRPAIHLTAETGWLNDPNGLVYYEGRWHAFFQHNPVGLDWGNMHWGHAVSDDLIHWEQLGDALYPDETGDMFSGSAVIDHDNLLGLKNSEHDPVILFYTAAGNSRELNRGKKFTQCMAYSTDGMKTFHKYAGNPVVPHIKGDNRDPKVIRDPASGMYVMAFYLDGDEYALLTSGDLLHWSELQRLNLPGDNECPDFYPLDDGGKTRWVFTGAHDCAVVGDFDITRGFTPVTSPEHFGFGDVYAAQTFEGTNGRRVRLSWNRFGRTGSKYFTCELGVPCEMTLKNGHLRVKPAREVDACFPETEENTSLPSHGVVMSAPLPCDISFRFSEPEETILLKLFGNFIEIDGAGTLSVNGRKGQPVCASDGRFGLRIIADTTGFEIFEPDGRVFGSYGAKMEGNNVSLMGEGSLDSLTIKTGGN